MIEATTRSRRKGQTTKSPRWLSNAFFDSSRRRFGFIKLSNALRVKNASRIFNCEICPESNANGRFGLHKKKESNKGRRRVETDTGWKLCVKPYKIEKSNKFFVCNVNSMASLCEEIKSTWWFVVIIMVPHTFRSTVLCLLYQRTKCKLKRFEGLFEEGKTFKSRPTYHATKAWRLTRIKAYSSMSDWPGFACTLDLKAERRKQTQNKLLKHVYQR